MTLKLQSSIVFTEDEYQNLFCGTRNKKASLAELRVLLTNLGIKNVNKIKHCDIENFIFNSIIWKTDNLLFVYKDLVQQLSYNSVLNHVKTKRYNKDVITFYYNHYVTGIILSNSINKEIEYQDAQKRANIKKYIEYGKSLLQFAENNPYDNTLCACTTEHKFNFIDITFC